MVSFSPPNISNEFQSGTSGSFSGVSDSAANISPNRPVWPLSRSFCDRVPCSIARSRIAHCCARFPSSASIAPALIKLSIARLFKAPKLTLSQNSNSEANLPTSLRALIIPSTAPWPKFLIAPRPKRIAGPSGVKLKSEEFTSGGFTVIPISRHSLIYFTTFAVLPVSEVSRADMNSTG